MAAEGTEFGPEEVDTVVISLIISRARIEAVKGALVRREYSLKVYTG